MPNTNSLPFSPSGPLLSKPGPSSLQTREGPLLNKPGQSSLKIKEVHSDTVPIVPIVFVETVNCAILSLVETIRILQFTRPVLRVFATYSSIGPIHTITQSESDASS